MCTIEMANSMAAVAGGDRDNDLGVQWMERMRAARNLAAPATPDAPSATPSPPGSTPPPAAQRTNARSASRSAAPAMPSMPAYPRGMASGQFVGEQGNPPVVSIVPAGQFVGEQDMPRPMPPPSGQFMGDVELRMAPYPTRTSGQFTGEPMNTIVIEPLPLPLPPPMPTQADIDRADAFAALRASREAEAARRGERMPMFTPPPFVAEPPPEFVPMPAQPRGVPPRDPRLQMLNPPPIRATPDYALPMPTPAAPPPPRR